MSRPAGIARRATARLRVAVAFATAGLAVATAGLAFGVVPAQAGTISGTVTDAAAAGPPTSYVCVLALNPDGDATGSTSTDAAGSYALSGLAAGAYRVEFVDDGGCLSQAGTYAFQYYPGVASPAQATSVTVGAGTTTSGIDAALVEGGGITGQAAAAGDGQPLAGVCARLLGLQGDFILQQPTDPSGAYDLEQLPAGQYKLEFVDDGCTGRQPAYSPQYFDAESTLAQADPITVQAGQTTSAIDARLVGNDGGGGGGSGGTGSGGAGGTPGSGGGPGSSGGPSAGGGPGASGGPRTPAGRQVVLARLSVPRAGVVVDRRGRFALSLRCLVAQTCRVSIAVRSVRAARRSRLSGGMLVARTRSGSPARIGPHRRRLVQLRLRAAGRRLIGAAGARGRLRVVVLVRVVAGPRRSRLRALPGITLRLAQMGSGGGARRSPPRAARS